MGQLTTHILDTANGRPAAGVAIRLFRCDPERRLLLATQSNSDGRCDAPLLGKEEFEAGTYELEFAVAEYFDQDSSAGQPPFLDVVTLRVTLGENQHYHVPLLVSPWSYSTYRGS